MLQSARALMERVAASLGLNLRWLAVAERISLRGASSASLRRNVAAQFEAALRTVALGSHLPLSVIFLLNQDGQPRGAEKLHGRPARSIMQQENFVAAFEIEQLDRPPHEGGRDVWILWIDDATAPAPLRNPYNDPVKYFLYRRYPLVLDFVRQKRTDRLNQRMLADIASSQRAAQPAFRPAPIATCGSDQKVALFCLYWLDYGGAEAFALCTMHLARDAGFRVIVICDELGRHRVLERAHEIADAIYLIGNFGAGLEADDALLRVVSQHRPEVIHIHHSFSGYRTLSRQRALGSNARVIDSTHLLEHRNGDFPKLSAANTAFIDLHHVISNDLVRFYKDVALVPQERIRLGRLYDMAQSFFPAPRKWENVALLKVAFVGRFTQQKRPYLFIELARRLVRRFGAERFRFQAVGEGQLRAPAEAYAEQLGVSEFVEFLPGNAPVEPILSEAHVLVVCSDNEGLTLVGFEAARADCLVVSCDVGGQRELVAEDLLVQRSPFACVREMAERVSKIALKEPVRAALLERQKVKLEAIMCDSTGSDVCSRFYRTHCREDCNSVALPDVGPDDVLSA